MLFRRGGRSDDRRRRVLNDTLAASASGGQLGPWQWGAGAVASPVPRRSKNYGDAEFLHQQPRPTDLVPSRLISFLVLFALGAGAIVALVALHGHKPRLAQWTGQPQAAAFDLTVRGSLATWFSSILLAVAALTALIVYGVRRFKADDYRGHYRVWLWAAACWLLLSIDTTAGLHQAFAAAMVALTGARLLGDGSVWWVIAYGFLLGGIGTRLLADMRSCRLSAATLILGLASFAAAVAGQFGWIELPEDLDPAIAIRGSVLAGDLLVLLAMGLHARHVILDAKGLLPQKSQIDEDAEDEIGARIRAAGLAGGTSLTIHPPHGLPAPTPAILSASQPVSAPSMFTPVSSVPTSPSTSALGGGWPNGQVSRRLTKQEKRALRERLERMRQERRARAG